MMNKEQLDAIKERVASMKQQARTDVTADISAIEIAFQDVPALITEVERLQKANRERVEIIEEQNKELNNFRMDKSLMDFGISKERVRVVEKEKIPNQAFRNRKRQVKHLTRGCIRRNAEIKRLREALEFYADDKNYKDFETSITIGDTPHYFETNNIEIDNGSIAEKALGDVDE